MRTPSRPRIASLFAISIVLIAVLGFFIIHANLKRQQASIQLTPREVIVAFQNAGYQMDHIIEYGEGKVGPLGNVGRHLRCSIKIENEIYELLVVQYDTWEKADGAVKFTNDLSKKWNGGLAYAFHYGDVFVALWPTDKKIGKQLLSVLEASQDRIPLSPLE